MACMITQGRLALLYDTMIGIKQGMKIYCVQLLKVKLYALQ